MTPEKLAHLAELLDDLLNWLDEEEPSLDVAMVEATGELVVRLGVALSLDGAK